MPTSTNLLTVCALIFSGCATANGPGNEGPNSTDVQLGVQVVASGLDDPLYLTAPAVPIERLNVAVVPKSDGGLMVLASVSTG